MAYCENINCRKTGLRKEDVELDREFGGLLCHGCYCLRHPGWKPPEEVVVLPPANNGFGYAVTLDSYRGASARFNYGDVNFEFIMPAINLQKFFGQRLLG
jgi:hypothetical protein